MNRPQRRQRPGQESRIRRSALAVRQRRLARTVVLGTLAVTGAIAWLAHEWEADTDELIDYALTSVLLVLLVVAFAAVGGLLLWGARRLLRGRRR